MIFTYRVWANDEKQYYTVFGINYETGDVLAKMGEKSRVLNMYNDECILEALTPLEDKHAFSVYEGDVIVYKGHRLLVEYDKINGAFVLNSPWSKAYKGYGIRLVNKKCELKGSLKLGN